MNNTTIFAQSVTDAITWSERIERLGIIAILALLIILGVAALARKWFVPGWLYEREYEEKIMWRDAYVKLRESTNELTQIAKTAVRR